jgi:hypothetical protein
MKKMMKSAAAAIALSALAAPAFADNFLLWDVLKLSYYQIDVTVSKEKTADINVNFDRELEGSASSMALVNSTNSGHDVTQTGGSSATNGTQRTAVARDSMNENTGIGQVNQDAGNMANQGNVAAVGLNLGDDSFTMAEAYVEQTTEGNSTSFREGGPGLNAALNGRNPNLEATGTNVLNGNTGVYHFNQNAGSVNSQHNVLSAALGNGSAMALADAGLAQATVGNTVGDVNTVKKDLIQGSVNGNQGIVNYNQAVGSMNSQATIVNVSANTSSVGL